MTLNDLIKAKPEWADLPIAVIDSSTGTLHYVGASGAVYDSLDHAEKDEKTGKPSPVLLFSTN